MLLTNNYSNTKLNKYCDVNDTKPPKVVDLLKDFLSINVFKIGYDRKIKNSLLQQTENNGSAIVIKIRDFQNIQKILSLIRHLSEEEIELALRLAIVKSFNCNLSYGKIIFVQKYPLSAIYME